MKKSVEIIAQSPQDAINAQKGGADRVELVSALSQGGLTPSFGMIKSVLESTSIEISVMLRPTSQSFCYDRYCLDVMKKDISIMEKLGVHRVVLGILDQQGNIDFKAMDYVLSDTTVPVTFHRAIDSAKDIIKSVQELNEYKRVTHILTSGGEGKALDNIEKIKKMLTISRPRIIIGSGLNLQSIDTLNFNISEDMQYDIHFGTYVQDENTVVNKEKVRNIVNIF